MKTIIQFPNKARIEEEAADWVIKLNGGDLSERERTDLQQWLDSDPSHREAVTRLARIWSDMSCLRLLADLFPTENGEPQEQRDSRFRPLSAPVLGCATAAVLVVAFFLTGMMGKNPLWPSVPANDMQPVEVMYRTSTGQQSEIMLADGSLLTLNTSSEARVRFGQSERAVYLVEGEAHFSVARNPEKPFVVYAGKGSVRAIGTAFNVRLFESKISVLVAEGTVDVSSHSAEAGKSEDDAVEIAPGKRKVRLKAGGMVTFAEVFEEADYLPESAVESRLAWRQGKWVFEGETLAEVVQEVSRYTDTKIEITDPRVAQVRVGGYFDIGKIDGLLKTLESGFGIEATEIADNHIQLSLAETAHPR